MDADRADPTELKRVLAAIEPVLAARDLAEALRESARVLAGLAGASWCSVLLVEQSRVVSEGWQGAGDPPDAALRSLCRQAATGTAGPEAGEAPPATREVTTLRFEAGPAAEGVVCLAPALPLTDAEVPVVGLAALLRVVGLRIHALNVVEASLGQRAQYERWFRTLDEQVRVLDRERQKFAAVVQQSDSRVFVADSSLHIRWTNSIMREKSWAEGEVPNWIGQTCRAVCSRMGEGLEAGCVDCPIQRAFSDNQIAHREFRWEHARETHHHYLTALPIRGADGVPQEVMVTIQNLGDLGTLRRSEARYRMLFEGSNKAILLIEPGSGRILQANPMAARITGFDTRELSRMHLRMLHGPEEWARLEGHYAAAMSQRVMEPRECRIRMRDGGERVAMVAGARYDLGEQDVVMLDLQDVTERRRVEEALRKAETSLRTVISHAPIVLFSIDTHGIFTMSEGRGLESLGLRPGQVVGSSAFDLYEGAPEILDHIRRTLAGSEFTASSAVGDLTFETHYTPTRDTSGHVTGLTGVAIDVSDRRRLEERLVHSQKMEAIGRLAGGVAHDFNNLLAAILGHCELMLDDLDARDPMRAGIEEIHRAGGRGAMLTRQLLAFSRRDVPAPEAIDLRAVVSDLDPLLRRLIGEDIELIAGLDEVHCVVCADRGQLEQTVLNLVVNARDALPGGGRIAIDVHAVEVGPGETEAGGAGGPGSYVRLAVTDDGTGMDPETLAHVFEPFYTTKEQGKGTGLGLSTVYGIAERNRGWVRATSEREVGSTFQVYLPRLSEAPLPQDAAEPGPVRGGSETILLVEDEAAVRDLVCEALTDQGYRVLAADCGPAALAIAEAHAGDLDLLLTDVVMPRMGGGELAARMSATRPGVRVLFMSGYTDDAVVRHGVYESRVAFLQKPFRLDDLARKVRDVLDASELAPPAPDAELGAA